MDKNDTTFPLLRTDRLTLRRLEASDAVELFAIHSDRDAMQWFGVDPMSRLDQARELIETFARWRTAPNPGTRWGIERNDDARLIGTCGLFKWQRDWRKCMVSYELSRAATGQGYMEEALHAVLPWGLREMELNRVEALIHPDNLPSIRLAERLGFVFEGTLREGAYWSGSFHDMQVYALLAHDYRPL